MSQQGPVLRPGRYLESWQHRPARWKTWDAMWGNEPWLRSVGLQYGLWKIYSQMGETKPTLNWREGISRVSETIETATSKENIQLIIRSFKPACVSPAQNMVALYQGFRKINMNQDPTQPPLLQKSCGAKPAGQLRTSTETLLWECTC